MNPLITNFKKILIKDIENLDEKVKSININWEKYLVEKKTFIERRLELANKFKNTADKEIQNLVKDIKDKLFIVKNEKLMEIIYEQKYSQSNIESDLKSIRTNLKELAKHVLEKNEYDILQIILDMHIKDSWITIFSILGNEDFKILNINETQIYTIIMELSRKGYVEIGIKWD